MSSSSFCSPCLLIFLPSARRLVGSTQYYSFSWIVISSQLFRIMSVVHCKCVLRIKNIHYWKSNNPEKFTVGNLDPHQSIFFFSSHEATGPSKAQHENQTEQWIRLLKIKYFLATDNLLIGRASITHTFHHSKRCKSAWKKSNNYY